MCSGPETQLALDPLQSPAIDRGAPEFHAEMALVLGEQDRKTPLTRYELLTTPLIIYELNKIYMLHHIDY